MTRLASDGVALGVDGEFGGEVAVAHRVFVGVASAFLDEERFDAVLDAAPRLERAGEIRSCGGRREGKRRHDAVAAVGVVGQQRVDRLVLMGLDDVVTADRIAGVVEDNLDQLGRIEAAELVARIT